MPSSRLEDYDVVETIGSGSYGTCRKIRRRCDGKVLVWKELNYGQMTESEKQMLVSEVNLLRELRHGNIVRYYDRIIDKIKATIYIVMEYCEKGDLNKVISKHKRERKPIEEQFIWKVLYQLSLALQECHRKKGGGHILHRDLKPANVFIDAEENLKLGDFGLARVLHETSFARTFVGTPYYMSPEQVSKMSYNEKSDIWSLGCLLYELCALHPPFLAMDQRSLAVKIRDGRFKPIPNHFSDELGEFIKWMLQVEDNKRPSIDDILRHHSVAKYSNIFNAKDRKQSSTELQSVQLRRKEEALRTKEKLLNDKERELERRERILSEREALVAEKLARADRMMQEVYSNDYREDEPFTFKRPKRSQVYPSGKENLDSDRIFQERNFPGNKNIKINSLLPAQQGIKEPGSLDVLCKIDNYSDRFRLRRNSKQRGTNPV
ncbi:serine/threonine-protein kinase Nek2-like [Rhopilema esculentum]|uniref:serine/threonine-protein kinase Nek2-like n=1 Tax=Rhopilema esculentum TaxID=499914 RepID=UPI0031CEE341